MSASTAVQAKAVSSTLDVESGTDASSNHTQRSDSVPNKWMLVPPEGDDLFHRFLRGYYMPFFVRYSRSICVAWVAIFVVCLIFGPKFLSLTRSNFDLPEGTDSGTAVKAFQAAYPDASSWPPAFVVQRTHSQSSAIGPKTQEIAVKLQEFKADHATVIDYISGYWELSADPSLALLAAQAVSTSGKTLVSTVAFRADTDLTSINKVVPELIHFVEKFSGGDFTVATTGLFPLFSEMSEATTHNFELIDAIVLPIAVLILGYRVRSYRHMGVAFCCLGCSLLLAFAVLVPLAEKAIDINPFTPSVMLSLGIAVSFDYGLFMLTRFREERVVNFKSKEDAVFTCLAAAGHVVTLSGLTLVLTFVLLLAFPQNFLQSIGYGCGVVVLTSIIANMTVTPAMLLAFDCLSYFDPYPTSLAQCMCRVKRGDPAIDARAEAEAEAEANAAKAAAAAAAGLPKYPPKKRSFWFWLSHAVSGRRVKWPVFLSFLAITAGFASVVVRMTPTSDDQVIYLQDSPSLNALKSMKEDFSVGSLDPYQLILITGTPNAVLTEDYFKAENAMIHRILDSQTKFVDTNSIEALSFYLGKDVPWATGMGYFNPSSPTFSSVMAAGYRALVGSKLNKDKSTSMVTIETLVNPNSQVVVDFIHGVRKLIKAFPSTSPVPSFPVTMHLFGAYTTTMDVQDKLYELVPLEISVVVLIVLTVVGLSFGSVGLAGRLLITISMSLVWAYGLMVLVYQPGPAQDAFAKITPTVLASSGIYWIIPVMSFSILVGLALDYDIFLVSRMLEFRQLGWSDRAAVCLAVEKSGPVITAAGLIMSVSFAGLLIPKTVVLNQYGFSLFVGVALDTFIVRTILVPCVIAIFGDVSSVKANWWPRVMPAIVLSEDDETRALIAGMWEPVMVPLEEMGEAVQTQPPAFLKLGTIAPTPLEAPVPEVQGMVNSESSVTISSKAQ